MTRKYTKKGVKRQHSIIEGVLRLLEEIAAIDGVKKAIPGVISYSPKRGIKLPFIKISRDTITGIRLLAKSKGKIQEVFVICDPERKDEIKNTIGERYEI